MVRAGSGDSVFGTVIVPMVGGVKVMLGAVKVKTWGLIGVVLPPFTSVVSNPAVVCGPGPGGAVVPWGPGGTPVGAAVVAAPGNFVVSTAAVVGPPGRMVVCAPGPGTLVVCPGVGGTPVGF